MCFKKKKRMTFWSCNFNQISICAAPLVFGFGSFLHLYKVHFTGETRIEDGKSKLCLDAVPLTAIQTFLCPVIVVSLRKWHSAVSWKVSIPQLVKIYSQESVTLNVIGGHMNWAPRSSAWFYYAGRTLASSLPFPMWALAGVMWGQRIRN